MLVKKTAQDCQISFGIILKGMYQTQFVNANNYYAN